MKYIDHSNSPLTWGDLKTFIMQSCPYIKEIEAKQMKINGLALTVYCNFWTVLNRKQREKQVKDIINEIKPLGTFFKTKFLIQVTIFKLKIII